MIQNDKVCDTAYGDFGGYVVLGAMEVVRTPSSRATRILAVDAKVKDGGKGGSRPTGMKAFIQGVRSSETSQWRDQRDPGQWSRFVGLTLELWRCWGTKTISKKSTRRGQNGEMHGNEKTEKTRKPRKPENRENQKTEKTRKPRKRENRENEKTEKTEKTDKTEKTGQQ